MPLRLATFSHPHFLITATSSTAKAISDIVFVTLAAGANVCVWCEAAKFLGSWRVYEITVRSDMKTDEQTRSLHFDQKS